MKNFTYDNRTELIFGKDTHKKVGEKVKQYSNNILLHYGGGSIQASGLYDEVIQSLEQACITYHELSGVKPNPRLSLVQEGIDICRKNNIDFILAVGGGSVIDSAKAIGVGVMYEGDVWDFYIKKAEPQETLPVGSILTLAAAGSESSISSVITNEDGWYKRPLDTNVIRPAFAIMNPELTYTVPPYHTMCGIADIMSHVLERYFTQEENNDLTDRLCEGTLKTIITQAYILKNNPTNYAARAEILLAGTLAHNGFLDVGRVGDWGTHMIEHELSGIYDVSHGAGIAALFPSWMKYVYEENLDRFEQFAIHVWDVEPSFGTQKDIALEGINRFKQFLTDLGLPIGLKDLNIPTDSVEKMATKSVEFGTIGQFKKLEKEDVLAILKMAFA